MVMARTLEPLKLDDSAPSSDKGFLEGLTMGVVLNVKGLEVLVFLYGLQIYVMLPNIDLEAHDIVIRAEKEILDEMKEEFGRELKGVTFFKSVVH